MGYSSSVSFDVPIYIYKIVERWRNWIKGRVYVESCLNEEANFTGSHCFCLFSGLVEVTITTKATFGDESPIKKHIRLQFALYFKIDIHVSSSE